MRTRPAVPRFVAITDDSTAVRHDPATLARAAWAGGADAVQWRDKSTDAVRRRAVAESLAALRREFPGRLFFVNDDPALAAAVDADGVHVGPDDPSPAAARAAVGESRLVGFSAGTPEEARWAEQEGADYLGVGPVFGTGSKADAGEAIGLDGLERVARATRLPVLAIGGVTAERVADVAARGAHGVAVVSAWTRAPDPETAARALARALRAALAARGTTW